MEKVNPGLVVRDKQGRSYAERELSEDRGYNAAPVPGAQAKSGHRTNGHFIRA